MDAAAIDALRARIAAARRVTVMTGAGMSAESGIATFRDALTGLWAQFDPEQLASVDGYRADPGLVWDWYAERRDGVRRAAPNAGHRALGAFAAARPGVLTVVTQNVDDLHQRAGNADAVRLHGDILATQWLDPCPQGRGCDVAQAAPGRPPRCADCGNLLRPAVVWFGEMLPPGAMRAANRALWDCQVFVVVGTSGVVWPAAGMAAEARREGAHVVIVNPHPTEIDAHAHVLLRGTAAQVLPQLFVP
jgi:NAD-dependent deacetylase